METTFYPEDTLKRKLPSSLFSGATLEDDRVKKLKKTMTLDFNSAGKKQNKLQILQSPDLNMLKLASPELERMIIQANGMVTTTPTPTQFVFPKFVTEEQEAYARGFVDALAELHSDKEVKPSRLVSANEEGTFNAPNSTAFSVPTCRVLTTTTSLPGGVVNSGGLITSQQLQASKAAPQQTTDSSVSSVRIPRLKEEPQTVPCMSMSPPPVSPINMDTQEKIKLERKRARNRVAARKCRTRKLERIARLEEKVNDLKGQNADLAKTATSLRDQVCKLKKQIIEHVGSGCQIMMTQNIFS